MSSRPLCISVTGLNATDNPAPGVSVIRALRRSAQQERFGLAYDALDQEFTLPRSFLMCFVAVSLSRLGAIFSAAGLYSRTCRAGCNRPDFGYRAARLYRRGSGAAAMELRRSCRLLDLAGSAQQNQPWQS